MGYVSRIVHGLKVVMQQQFSDVVAFEQIISNPSAVYDTFPLNVWCPSP